MEPRRQEETEGTFRSPILASPRAPKPIRAHTTGRTNGGRMQRGCPSPCRSRPHLSFGDFNKVRRQRRGTGFFVRPRRSLPACLAHGNGRQAEYSNGGRRQDCSIRPVQAPGFEWAATTGDSFGIRSSRWVSWQANGRVSNAHISKDSAVGERRDRLVSGTFEGKMWLQTRPKRVRAEEVACTASRNHNASKERNQSLTSLHYLHFNTWLESCVIKETSVNTTFNFARLHRPLRDPTRQR